MNPPIRDKSHYDRLWYGVRNNFNDTIGSDHAPHLKVNKDSSSFPEGVFFRPQTKIILDKKIKVITKSKTDLLKDLKVLKKLIIQIITK